MLKKWSGRYIRANKRIAMALTVAALIGLIEYVVYLSGGTEMAFTHLMYLPIILSAFYFGIKGTVAAAFLCGLALGPWMPADVLEGMMQKPAGWLFRTAMFLVIGIITAILFQCVRNFKENEIIKSFRNTATGFPNVNQLKLDLTELIDRKEGFSVIGFRITNIEDINLYAGYEIGTKAIRKAAELLAGCVKNTVYSIDAGEFAAMIPGGGNQDPYLIGMKYIGQLKEPLSISRFRIELMVKGGMVSPSRKGEDAAGLIKKLGIAMDQKTNGTGFTVYDPLIEQKSKENYELMVSLFDAIKNEELSLVYQPKKNVSDDSLTGVEALLRWNHGTKGQISPEVFIKMAEEIGFINEITKWVIKNVIHQIKEWQSEGLSLAVAINISSKDLKNHAVSDYLKKSLEENALEPAMIELELTERCVLSNTKKVSNIMNDLRKYGIRISLDDFGTGYNSMIDLIKIPVDSLKIDKIFIDHITDGSNRAMIENIIDFAHRTGKKVVAEGVEAKEQLDELKNLGCDYVQGYYFSKPLPPDEIKKCIRQTAAN